MIRAIYLELLNSSSLNNSMYRSYQECEDWLKLPKVHLNFEELSKRYHFHLEKAQKEQTELLPYSKHLDTPSKTPFLPIDIYLDNLRSLHNIGSIVRTIEAFRLGTLCTPKDLDLSHCKLKKTAMGSETLIPLKTNAHISSLKKPLIGIEITNNAKNIFEFSFPKSFSLLLGNEECGLSQDTIKHCDHILQIPMFGQKNSLNVSNAFAIAASLIRNTT